MQRPVNIVVPFRLDGAKSRLSPALDKDERREMALAMLRDVLACIGQFGNLTVLTRPEWDMGEDGSMDMIRQDIKVMPSNLDLNDALNMVIEREAQQGWRRDLLIVMADLALLEKGDIEGILSCPGDVVLCPGRGGGTNMILIRSPRFRTCYQGLSYPKHKDIARKMGLCLSVYESFRAGCDIDQPEDLAEILLHGRGEARALLLEWGFRLSEERKDSIGRAPIDR
jgi:2-phospho-L-lactate guanylyltransferase